MSSDYSHNNDNSQASGSVPSSSYTPTPIKKSRNVTGAHIAIDLQSDFSQNSQNYSAVAQTPVPDSMSVDQNYEVPARPSSIQINLDTFGVSNQELMEQEQRTQAKMAEFEPLSAVPYQTPTPTYEPAQPAWDQNHADPWGQVAQEPVYSSDPFDSDYNPKKKKKNDLYRSRRRAIKIILLLLVISVWVLAMLVQVGVERFVADPIGETMKVFSSTPDHEMIVEVPPETQVNIQKISAVAQVRGVELIDKRVYMVHGVLSNQGSDMLGAVLLKVTLRAPLGSVDTWEQYAEFNCCQEVNFSGMDRSAQRAFLKELKAGTLKQEGSVRLPSGRVQPFSVALVLDEVVPLKKGETPQANIQVLFAE